jgi:hypothetical protein
VTAIETSEVTDLLVGITPAYLNTFLQRKLYGITASVQAGKVREKRRLFSEGDVYGIALVWMLFEGGLRTQSIRRILNSLAKTKKADARITAEVLRKARAEYIVVVREPRKPSGNTEPEPEIRPAKKGDLQRIIAKKPTANVLMVPIGQKFEDIRKRMGILL